MIDLKELNERLSRIEREKKGIALEDALREEMANYKGEDEVVSFEDYKKTHIEFVKQGFSSGMPSLDRLIDKFHEGDLVTITASTGQGKTSWCQYLTVNFANSQKKSLWFSYEVPVMNFLLKFGEQLPEGYVPNLLTERSLVWIERKIVEAIVKFKVSVVFVDHLHYLFNLRETRNVSLEIGEIMRTLKIIAKKYSVTIFIVAHTGKIEDGRSAVGLNNIRDSSFVGQESDYVFALWRIKLQQTWKQIEDFGVQYKNETVISVIKNRYNGQLGSVRMYYDLKNNRFTELVTAEMPQEMSEAYPDIG